MMRLLTIVFMLICFSAFRTMPEELFRVPKNFPNPLYDFSNNVLTPEKVILGRALFYDPLFSRNNSISCASCHSVYNAFAHTDHDLSHGIDDKIGKRNAPALMNLAWQRNFMWDGAINHLDMQALAPISHPLEMDENIAHVVEKLRDAGYYHRLFQEAYRDTALTGERILKALAQFQLTLVSCNSKYDKVMSREEVFTAQEANGYRLFKQNCNSCHTEPLFSSYDFANNGLPIDTTLNDHGRVVISGNPDDSLKFKIPTLRNVEYSNPYMHDGRFTRLSEVINHYTTGIRHSKSLAKELELPIILTENEKVDLVAFLLSLSDKSYIFNPDYTYPGSLLLK